MENPKTLTQVSEFHHTFKHPIVEEPTIPSEARCKLRISLISEELEELKSAINDKNLTEIADALCDLQYVLSGTILEFGLGTEFKQLFDEVHRSNMSKACKTLQEAEETITFFKNTDSTEAYYEEIDGYFLVYRKLDKKTLKSIAYSPANLTRILNSR